MLVVVGRYYSIDFNLGGIGSIQKKKQYKVIGLKILRFIQMCKNDQSRIFIEFAIFIKYFSTMPQRCLNQLQLVLRQNNQTSVYEVDFNMYNK